MGERAARIRQSCSGRPIHRNKRAKVNVDKGIAVAGRPFASVPRSAMMIRALFAFGLVLAPLAALAASPPELEAAFGATIVSTYPSGRSA